jgi:hypothetical protein
MKYVLHAEGYSVEGWAGLWLRKSRLERGSFVPKSLEAISRLGEEGLDVRLPFLKTGFKRVQIVHYGKSTRPKPLCEVF